MYCVETWHFVFIRREMARMCLKNPTQHDCTVALLKLFIANPPELLCTAQMKHDSGVQLHGASSDGPRLGGTGRHMSHLLPSKSEPEGIGKSNCRLSPGVTILLASCRSGHLPSPARVLDHEAPIWSLERQFPCLLWLTFNVLWTFSPNESGFVPDERDERATVQMYAAHAAKPVKAFFPPRMRNV